jgi:hypothetical protein
VGPVADSRKATALAANQSSGLVTVRKFHLCGGYLKFKF